MSVQRKKPDYAISVFTLSLTVETREYIYIPSRVQENQHPQSTSYLLVAAQKNAGLISLSCLVKKQKTGSIALRRRNVVLISTRYINVVGMLALSHASIL